MVVVEFFKANWGPQERANQQGLTEQDHGPGAIKVRLLSLRTFDH
jgi:hypothetical protein